MAEIKSTLDLIMERTKNLSLTPEERTEIRLKEIQAKVNGWTQRYIDGLLNASDVKNELESLKEDKDAALVFCRKAALAHIAPEGDNTRILSFIQDILEEDVTPLIRRIDTFKAETNRQKAALAGNVMYELKQKGIHGSAVIPNLNHYPEWQAWQADALDAFQKSLGAGEEAPT